MSAPDSAPLNDGIPNLLKYLFDIVPSRPMNAADRAALPAVGLVSRGGSQYITLTFRQFALTDGIVIAVQTSPDLTAWTTATDATFSQVGTDAVTGDPIMQAQVLSTGVKEFVRLDVASPSMPHAVHERGPAFHHRVN